MQTLAKNWWLLALSGVLEAIVSVIYLIMRAQDRALTLHAWRGTVLFLGNFLLVAGLCTIAAAIWKLANGKSWLLLLNGLALVALGLIYTGVPSLTRGAATGARISFRSIVLLIVVMAITVGSWELVTARTLRSQRHVADAWLAASAGLASIGLAVAFLGFVFGWVKLDPGSLGQSFLWLGVYFGFSALCMIALALRLHSLPRFQRGPWPPLPHDVPPVSV